MNYSNKINVNTAGNANKVTSRKQVYSAVQEFWFKLLYIERSV